MTVTVLDFLEAVNQDGVAYAAQHHFDARDLETLKIEDKELAMMAITAHVALTALDSYVDTLYERRGLEKNF